MRSKSCSEQEAVEWYQLRPAASHSLRMALFHLPVLCHRLWPSDLEDGALIQLTDQAHVTSGSVQGSESLNPFVPKQL